MMERVRSVTYNIVSMLNCQSICKFLLLVLSITVFTFVSYIGESSYALAADTFCAYEQCPNPQPKTSCGELKFSCKKIKPSPECKEYQDYEINVTPPEKQKSDVTVLSIHGGEIEHDTSIISSHLSTRYNWNIYDFNGKITNPECSDLRNLNPSDIKNTNFVVLHITSTRFDDPRAVKLVSSHNNAVSIHGYRRTEDNKKVQTICVGGANKTQITKFIEYVKNNQSDEFKRLVGYSLNPINVPSLDEDDNSNICTRDRRLDGIDPRNIVNKNKGDTGGLQLEFNNQTRTDLAKGTDNRNASPSEKNQLLRNLIYEAINCAMGGNCLEEKAFEQKSDGRISNTINDGEISFTSEGNLSVKTVKTKS